MSKDTKNTLNFLSTCLAAIWAGMFFFAGLAAAAGPKMMPVLTYRCEDGVSQQQWALEQADLYWWGPWPYFRSTHDEHVIEWRNTGGACDD